MYFCGRMKKNNVLIVSLAFPPKNCPEGIQAAKYFRYLQPKLGNVQVVTSESPSLSMPHDESLLDYIPENLPVISLKVPESKYLNFAIKKTFPSLLELPDYKVLYSFFTRKIIRKLAFKPNVIYSRSYPLTSSFIAYKLVKKLGVPWVLHLSDPWSFSPIEHRTSYGQHFNERKERVFFQLADIVSFTTHETIERYSQKYPEYTDKFRWFPNVFDPKDIRSSAKIPKREFVFCYTGGLANTRNPKSLLKALSNLYQSQKKLFDGVRFCFAGSFDRKNQQLFKEFPLPFVENLGLLSKKEVSNLTSQSDVLLVVDTYFERDQDAMFLPSKLLDYAVTGKPVLAITNQNSATFRFVHNRLGVCFTHDDITGLAIFIKNLIQSYHQGKLWAVKPEKEFLQEYNADVNAGRLADLLNSF